MSSLVPDSLLMPLSHAAPVSAVAATDHRLEHSTSLEIVFGLYAVFIRLLGFLSTWYLFELLPVSSLVAGQPDLRLQSHQRYTDGPEWADY